ncbi:uncharacterized protein BO88DRAFT_257003 [Aspergillus vadensis CBS 113365]|uniref:Uncharacterized protein n=1 Tax=Aspergillus vadensis (strain CBS 113365 / IMI 142717 / IBT 24658) TaxID=1448311 RepID=A0A319BCP9_ASPVC|nr:hypothetical protein BO88DRAFT_257003 [Aspergillus vadensis CBS 113365]PYH70876.1 hypothetical protein BO88DRAFT_257003 [Aspergillus vadensis CBS 113365]
MLDKLEVLQAHRLRMLSLRYRSKVSQRQQRLTVQSPKGVWTCGRRSAAFSRRGATRQIDRLAVARPSRPSLSDGAAPETVAAVPLWEVTDAVRNEHLPM